MKNIMLDLETLGTTPGSVILSIGAVEFNLDGMVEDFHAVINIEDSLKYGLTTDAKTEEWWAKQTAEAQKTLELARDANRSAPLIAALQHFNGWVADKDARVWGNGASFDNVLLRAAYDAAKIRPVWAHYGDMCYRTLKNLFPQILHRRRTEVHHNALDDAKFQAQHALDIIVRL